MTRILDQYGQPMKRPRVSALAGGDGSGFHSAPYDAADIYGQQMANWNPFLGSADSELNMFRDRIVSRARDMVRNDGWAYGGVTRILDNVVGPNLRPISKPDTSFLCSVTGNNAFDEDWAQEFAEAVDASWESWANDVGRWCDATRNMNFAELMRVAFRHKLVDGDALAQVVWAEDRVGYGKARYATTIQLIDPDRLSNPNLQFDMQMMRGGVHVDQYGAADGYYIRRAHVADWFDAAKSVTWDLIPREYPWGRPIIVHDFDGDRATQHRGGAGIFTPVMQRLKMLVNYDNAELQSAVVNAIFAAYVESPFDLSIMQDALDDGSTQLSNYQGYRKAFHEANRINLSNARIPSLFPGEKIGTLDPTRPHSNFKEFENAVLRNVASGIGVSPQQITNDYSDTNYSSMRAALLESWKTMTRRRIDFSLHFCMPIRVAWMEEAMANKEFPLPSGVVPEFMQYATAYSQCYWMGPGRGWVDPVAEKQGAVLGMQAGLDTLEMQCAEQGLDWRKVIKQRAYEIKMFKENDIPLPDWTGENKGKTQGETGGNLPAKPKKPTGAPQDAVVQFRRGT